MEQQGDEETISQGTLTPGTIPKDTSVRGSPECALDGSLQDFRVLVGKMVLIYESCFPGPANIPSNLPLHSQTDRIKTGIADYVELDAVMRQIMYRMEVMEQANGFCHALGLDDEDDEQGCIPRIENVDMQQWVADKTSNTELLDRWIYARQQTVNAQIFRKPTPEEGREFMKPTIYLAACIANW